MVQHVVSLPSEPKIEAFPNRKYFGQSRVDAFEAGSLESIAPQVAVGAQGRHGECRSRYYTGKILLFGETTCLDGRCRSVGPGVGDTIGIPVSAVGDSWNDAFARKDGAGKDVERHTLFEHAQSGYGPTSKSATIPSSAAAQEGDVVEAVDAQALGNIETGQRTIFILIVLVLEC